MNVILTYRSISIKEIRQLLKKCEKFSKHQVIKIRNEIAATKERFKELYSIYSKNIKKNAIDVIEVKNVGEILDEYPTPEQVQTTKMSIDTSQL